MQLGQIYAQVKYRVYGETPANALDDTYFQGVGEGIICDMHKRIQDDHDYWFMEDMHAFIMVVGQVDYALPADFKKEVYLEFEDVVVADTYHEKLHKLTIKEWMDKFKDENARINYPTHYAIVYDSPDAEILTGPPPGQIAILWMVYYRYLPAVTVFATHEDVLTTEAPYLIIYMACAELETIRQNWDAAKVYSEKAAEELRRLKSKDGQRKDANLKFRFEDR